MVFNPEFLSQQARNILKIEKMTKKFIKKKLGSNKNHRLKKIISRDTKLKSEDFKPMNNYEMEPWFIRTSYDKNNYKFKKNGNNKINMNTNLDSSNESINIQNNYNYNSINYNNINKIPFNQTNYKRYNFQSPNNNNINTRYINMKKIFDEKFRNKKNVYQKEINNELNIQYFGVPQSFPGMTLLNFGKKKIQNLSNKIKLFRRKKNPSKHNIHEEKKSHKAEIINKIRETVKNNYLRNARRVAPPKNQ